MASTCDVSVSEDVDHQNITHTHFCLACHISCKLECLGPGAGGCVECRDGYNMENETCTGKLHTHISHF